MCLTHYLFMDVANTTCSVTTRAKSAQTVLVTSVDGQHVRSEKVFGVVEKSFDQFVYARNIGHIRWYKQLETQLQKTTSSPR